ncbi:hypothetical protein B0I35DRAFT_514256 [Stachybotrys elegans]|uniref:Uncharacterized protein n=1 Tax=Stachybotrys elegans TaxID=80388 RepID=A0A8K0SIY8_9HYPO|nr:hypothetical protein B0I35DRAFT_514256 [Stachybotrys elegans]
MVIGATVALVAPDECGIMWSAKQVTSAPTLLHQSLASHSSRHRIEWGQGPLSLAGYVDINTYETGVEVAIMGISLGIITGNLKDGVGVSFALVALSGSVKLYLKNGNEIWVHQYIKTPFSQDIDEERKIDSL